VIWPDESIHWLRCKGQFSKALPTQVIGLAIEVTWLKRSEEQHLQIEERLRKAHDELEQCVQERTADLEKRTAEIIHQAKLLDLANDAIFVRGADDRISYWNEGRATVRLDKRGGYRPVTHDLLDTEFPIPVLEVLNSDRWEGELRHTKRDGTKITVATDGPHCVMRRGGQSLVGNQYRYFCAQESRTGSDAPYKSHSELTRYGATKNRRELHDCLGQYLTGLKINLDLLAIPDQSHGQRSKADAWRNA